MSARYTALLGYNRDVNELPRGVSPIDGHAAQP